MILKAYKYRLYPTAEQRLKIERALGCYGFINHDLTLSQREWDCPQCHSPHDRDINGAKNIKFVGLQSGKRIPEGLVEMSALAGSMKQELSRY